MLQENALELLWVLENCLQAHYTMRAMEVQYKKQLLIMFKGIPLTEFNKRSQFICQETQAKLLQ